MRPRPWIPLLWSSVPGSLGQSEIELPLDADAAFSASPGRNLPGIIVHPRMIASPSGIFRPGSEAASGRPSRRISQWKLSDGSGPGQGNLPGTPSRRSIHCVAGATLRSRSPDRLHPDAGLGTLASPARNRFNAPRVAAVAGVLCVDGARNSGRAPPAPSSVGLSPPQ